MNYNQALSSIRSVLPTAYPAYHFMRRTERAIEVYRYYGPDRSNPLLFTLLKNGNIILNPHKHSNVETLYLITDALSGVWMQIPSQSYYTNLGCVRIRNSNGTSAILLSLSVIRPIPNSNGCCRIIHGADLNDRYTIPAFTEE